MFPTTSQAYKLIEWPVRFVTNSIKWQLIGFGSDKHSDHVKHANAVIVRVLFGCLLLCLGHFQLFSLLVHLLSFPTVEDSTDLLQRECYFACVRELVFLSSYSKSRSSESCVSFDDVWGDFGMVPWLYVRKIMRVDRT